jgi:hypothetical protein
VAREIGKIGRPLSGNASGDPWLILRPEAKIGAEIKAAMGNDPKGHLEAHWPTEGWKIGPQAPAEDW